MYAHSLNLKDINDILKILKIHEIQAPRKSHNFTFTYIHEAVTPTL